MNKFFNTSVRVMSGIILGIIFLGMLFSGFIDYYGKDVLLVSNLILFVVVIIVSAIFLLISKRVKLNVNVDKVVLIIDVLLLVYQLFMGLNTYFVTGWDAGGLIDMAINRGFYVNYMSKYPNNLLLLYIEIFIARINDLLSIFKGDVTSKYTVFLLFNIVINNNACLLTYKCASLYLNKKYALICYVLSILLFGISPWIIVFYSDSVGILFPILIFYLYSIPKFKEVKKPTFYMILLVLIGIFAYFIKPQCVIILIAIIIYEVFNNFKNKKKLLKIGICALLSILCISPIQKGLIYIARFANAPLDSEKAFGPAHFLMMGLNVESEAGYSQDDVNFSQSFSNKSERNKANLEECANRIQNMGFNGLMEHLFKKALKIFNDGTFAWGNEGNFYNITTNNNTVCAKFLRSIYYTDGDNYAYFKIFEQFMWLFVFTFVIVAIIKKPNDGKSILLLAILGLTIFELLFEARARYLYTYLPIFCLIAGFGIKDIRISLIKQL